MRTDDGCATTFFPLRLPMLTNLRQRIARLVLGASTGDSRILARRSSTWLRALRTTRTSARRLAGGCSVGKRVVSSTPAPIPHTTPPPFRASRHRQESAIGTFAAR